MYSEAEKVKMFSGSLKDNTPDTPVNSAAGRTAQPAAVRSADKKKGLEARRQAPLPFGFQTLFRNPAAVKPQTAYMPIGFFVAFFDANKGTSPLSSETTQTLSRDILHKISADRILAHNGIHQRVDRRIMLLARVLHVIKRLLAVFLLHI